MARTINDETRQDLLQAIREDAGQNVHTARDRPWSTVVSLEFASEQAAVRFEHCLKSGSGRAFAKRHFAAVEKQGRPP